MGSSPALNVRLTDASFHPDSFNVVGGQLNVLLNRIPPNSNVTHVAVVRPRKFGYFNFTSAEVIYKPTENSEEVKKKISDRS